MKWLKKKMVPKFFYNPKTSKKHKFFRAIFHYTIGVLLPNDFMDRTMLPRERIKQIVIYLSFYTLLSIIVIVSFIPFLMVLLNSFRVGSEIQQNGFSLTLTGDYWAKFRENWELLKDYADIPLGFKNSVKVSTLTTLLSGYFSALTAYGFYNYRFKGNKGLFLFIIIFMMVPTQLAFIGYFKFVSNIGLLGTHWPIVIPAIASIGTVFFLRQYAEGVLNKEVIESARIDGAGELYIFHKIGIPLMMPGIATMSIFAFIGSWNNYLQARVLLTSNPSKWTLPLQIANLKGSNVWFMNQGALYMGLAASIFPIVIIFLIFSRWLVDSIAAGAVKG